MAEEPSREQLDFFESKIRPLLIGRCQECHNDESPESGLSVQSRAALLRGGKLGAALIPGKPKESLLVSAVNHDAFLKMPPKDKLATAELVALSKWIAEGAAWPGQETLPGSKPQTTVDKPSAAAAGELPKFTEEQRTFWAYQPLRRWSLHDTPAAPDLSDAAGERAVHPIDAMVREKLRERGIAYAPPATRRELIRRATYDLHGLPADEAAIVQFEQDSSPDAYARLIDRLLGSPRYGERWGRHWLDVARYAESNGLDENIAYANAFRYRDYVINSLNSDKPYDRFVQEQIAGDLLPYDPQGDASQGDPFDRLIATGFLAIGAKMLAEDDPVKMQMDIIDEQLTTLCQAFMGVTIGCARCHDHKFDPFPTTDYYALAGIFKSTQTMENHRVVAKWYERPLVNDEGAAKLAALEAELKTMKGQLADLERLAKDSSEAESLRKSIEQNEAARRSVAMAMGVTESKPEDLKVHLRGSHLVLGEVVPRRFPLIFTGLLSPDKSPVPDKRSVDPSSTMSDKPAAIDNSRSGRLELAQWMTHRDHPLTSRVMANRLWHWHFGRGIVPSVDNFGLLGLPPSHPELLDWLALELVDSQWSIKQLHRTIMLSETYQQSTQFIQASAEADPENQWLWRFRRRRLTGEETRDAILAVGAGLDLMMYGSLMKVENHKYVNTTGGRGTLDYDAPRRTLYLPIIRSGVYDVLQTLDFPDPAMINGQRQTSTVASQALLMMNSDLVRGQVESIADQIQNQHLDDAQAISAIYHRVLKRAPTPKEIAASANFIQQAVTQARPLSRRDCWLALSRVLISSNEFSYVD